MAAENVYVEFRKLKFSKDDLIGKGNETHSKVFKGEFEGKEVAIKRLPKEHWSFTENLNRVQHGDYDRHENIARYYMTEEDENFYYIVMELCNTTLGQFIKGKYEGPLVGSDKEILFQIARGIEYLTEKGLVNRNIHPDTILISLPDGKKILPKIKLVDFTFSRKLGEGKSEFEISQVYRKHGLNDWSAPELLREEKSYTAAVDVFSAGCVFAYVLSKGKHPFGAYYFRFANIAMGMLQMPAEIKDERAVDLIEKMLAFDPPKRITIHQVLLHPFFWDEEKCLTFIQVACKVLEPQAASKSRPSDGPLIAKLEADRNKIFTGHWPDHLTPNAKQNLFKGVFPMKNKEEVTKSVFFLLKAFRNKWEHNHDVDAAAKDEYGPPPKNYFNYWNSRFPRLLIHTWEVMRHSTDPAMQRFYSTS